MGWIKSILNLLTSLLGFGQSAVDNKREERALINSPEMKKREEKRVEAVETDRTEKTVESAVHGNQKSLDDLRKELGT